MENLWQKYGGSIQFVAVNMMETLADLQGWLAGMAGGITFPVLHNTDWSIASLYFPGGMMYWPYVVVIDPKGIIQQVFDDGTLFSEEELEGHALDALYARDPIDLELVVDVSDTMNDPPSSTPLGDSKLVLLKQAANIVMDVLVDHGQANDKMGLVRFSDDVTEYVHGGTKLQSLATNEVGLRGEIAALATGTCTAMGAGLQTAFDTLAAEGTQNRFAILCTDGMQNIEPKVAEVAGHYEIVDSGGWLCGSHSGVPAHPGVDIRTYDTRIHTIGVGITSAWEPLLQAVADQTGGFYRSTIDPATDLALIYAVDLCNCLAMGSPAVVRHTTGTFHPERCQAVEEFHLNRTARKVTVALFWQPSQRCSLTFWLRAPDNTLVPLDGTLKTLPDRRVATLYLPPVVGGTTVDPVGRWTIVIRGEVAEPGPVQYQVLVIAEDRETKCLVDYPRRWYSVGDIVPLAVRLPETGLPHRVVDVGVEMIRTQMPLAEVLHRFATPRAELEETVAAISRKRRDPRALVAAKLRRIATDPEMQKFVLPKRTKKSLRAETLEYTLGERELTIPLRVARPGVTSYRLELLCESGNSGPIERMNYVSVFAKPGPVYAEHSSVKLVKKDEHPVLQLTPRNEQGHLLGPGLRLEIEAADKRAPRGAVVVHDLLDGRYEVELGPALREGEGELSVSVEGTVVWKGTA